MPVESVASATMRGTDLAVLELAATRAELRGPGLRGWPIEPVTAGGGPLDVVALGVPVGAPVVDIPEAERYLRLGTCTLDMDPVTVHERQWLWTGALRNDCPRVLPGSSGSAVIDRAMGGLVGLVDTTTYKPSGPAPAAPMTRTTLRRRPRRWPSDFGTVAVLASPSAAR